MASLTKLLVHEWEVELRVALPDGGSFPSTVQGTSRCADFDECEANLEADYHEVAGSVIVKMKLTQHTENEKGETGTYTRYTTYGDARQPVPPVNNQNKLPMKEDEDDDGFYWFGACEGVKHVSAWPKTEACTYKEGD